MKYGVTPKKALLAALAAAMLLFVRGAWADQIKIAGWWGGHESVSFKFTGKNLDGQQVNNLQEKGDAGPFKVYDLTTDPHQQHSFEAWCIDIFHNFSFPVTSTDHIVQGGAAGSLINPTKSYDLGLLYTEHYAQVTSTSTSGSASLNDAAFQLAVWEIVNESGTAYNLGNGAFQATNVGTNTNSTYYQTVAEANLWLSQLHVNNAVSRYNVELLQVYGDAPTGYGVASGAQDLVVFVPVPEPETYLMLVAGLGMLGFAARWKKRRAA